MIARRCQRRLFRGGLAAEAVLVSAGRVAFCGRVGQNGVKPGSGLAGSWNGELVRFGKRRSNFTVLKRVGLKL